MSDRESEPEAAEPIGIAEKVLRHHKREIDEFAEQVRESLKPVDALGEMRARTERQVEAMAQMNVQAHELLAAEIAPDPGYETNEHLVAMIEELRAQRDEQRHRAEAAEERGRVDRKAAADQQTRDTRRFWIATVIAGLALVAAIAAVVVAL